ncbi:hypothetical protein KD913_04105 [Klebsiella pneumoniae]
MARTLEELLQQEKPEVVEAAKDKAEKILRELEGVDQDTPKTSLMNRLITTPPDQVSVQTLLFQARI